LNEEQLKSTGRLAAKSVLRPALIRARSLWRTNKAQVSKVIGSRHSTSLPFQVGYRFVVRARFPDRPWTARLPQPEREQLFTLPWL